MNKLLGVLALAVLVIGGLTGYRVYQNKKAEAAYKAAVFEFAKADFLAFTTQMSGAVGEKGADQLKKLADGFPKHDAGISYAGFRKRVVDGQSLYSPSVLMVWKGSSAEKAGVLPGDFLTAIGGVNAVLTCPEKGDEPCPSGADTEGTANRVFGSEGKSAKYAFARADGVPFTVTLKPEPYGQEIHDHILANLDGYRKRLDEIAPRVAALEGKVTAAADMKTVQALVPEANALAADINNVYQSVEMYIKTRVILPQPVTEARPQL